jgi:hypothetical protein
MTSVGWNKARPQLQKPQLQKPLLLPFLLVFAEFRDHAEIFQRRSIAANFSPTGNITQQPSHDFSASSFGQRCCKPQIIGLRQRTNLFSHMLP